jgi:hypothetical protein
VDNPNGLPTNAARKLWICGQAASKACDRLRRQAATALAHIPTAQQIFICFLKKKKRSFEPTEIPAGIQRHHPCYAHKAKVGQRPG